MYRKKIMGVFFVVFCLVFVVHGPVLSDDYPTKPITVIIPFSAGGTHDITARVFTSIIPQYLGQPVVVKLMPGAGGQLGTAAAVRAKPDGYTLLYSHKFIDQLQPLIEKLPYDTLKSLVAVWRLNYSPGGPRVMSVKPWKTVDELFDYIRKHPGEVKFGHSGKWGAAFTWGALLLTEADIADKVRWLGYKGGGPTEQALLAGETDFSIGMPLHALSCYKAGTCRQLAFSADKRLPDFPDVPTLKELGYKSELTMDRVVFAPRGVPEDRVKVLEDAFRKLAADKTYKNLMGKLGENTEYMEGAEYEKMRVKYRNEFKALVDKLGGK